MKIRLFRFFFFAVLAGAPLWPVVAQAGDAVRLTVVELFTSQGCSSCPDADALLHELAARDDVLALSLHVDYWNYIGWKDPFSSAAHTARQRAYADRLKLRYVYTPQIIVHGAAHAVGSDRQAVSELIKRHNHPPKVALSAAVTDTGGVQVHLPEAVLDQPATVWMAAFSPEHTTEVRRGENAGRTIVNANVVHEMRPVLDWGGRPMTFTIPPSQLATGGKGVALVVQSANKGPILGAIKLVRP